MLNSSLSPQQAVEWPTEMAQVKLTPARELATPFHATSPHSPLAHYSMAHRRSRSWPFMAANHKRRHPLSPYRVHIRSQSHSHSQPAKVCSRDAMRHKCGLARRSQSQSRRLKWKILSGLHALPNSNPQPQRQLTFAYALCGAPAMMIYMEFYMEAIPRRSSSHAARCGWPTATATATAAST